MEGVIHGSAALLFFGGVVYLLVGLRARRFHDTPSGIPFTATSLSWGLSAIVLAWLGAAGADRFDAAVIALVMFLPVPWAAFAMTYAGWRRPVTPGVVGGVTAAMLLVVTTVVVPLDLQSGSPAATAVAAVWMLGFLVAGGLATVGVAVVLRTATANPAVDTGPAGLIAVGGTGPWLALLLWGAFASLGEAAGLAELAVGVCVGAGAVAVATERTAAFESTPAAGNLGRSAVIADLDETVLIADDRGRVVDVNEAARDVFGASPADAAGRPLGEVLGVELSAIGSSDLLELHTAEGNREFRASVSTIADDHDRTLGHAILLRDVTEQRTRQQRLEVLNRVLRHNLRNDMNVVEGYAEMAGEQVDDATSDAYLERIARTASTLADLGEKARDVESLVTAPRVSDRQRSLSSVVDDVVEDLRTTYPDVTFRTALDVDTDLRLNPDHVEEILRQLVENAAEHNDADNPRVEVRTAAGDDDGFPLALTVADNGSGLPEHEWAVVESGDETQLEHGSGLGLWVVHWGVTRLGGSVRVAENEPRGSLVTVQLPEPIDDAERRVEGDQRDRLDPGAERSVRGTIDQ